MKAGGQRASEPFDFGKPSMKTERPGTTENSRYAVRKSAGLVANDLSQPPNIPIALPPAFPALRRTAIPRGYQ